MKAYIDKSALVAEIEKYISNYKSILNKVDKSSYNWLDSIMSLESKIDVLQHILSFLNTLEVKEVEEEPVSNDLEDYAHKESESFAEREYEIDYIDRNALAKGYYWGVKAGAEWQKEQKYVWSDEDEETMSGLLSFLLINTSDQWAKYGKWLKSIKQRIGG